jgi:DNA modification methylase
LEIQRLAACLAITKLPKIPLREAKEVSRGRKHYFRYFLKDEQGRKSDMTDRTACNILGINRSFPYGFKRKPTQFEETLMKRVFLAKTKLDL